MHMHKSVAIVIVVSLFLASEASAQQRPLVTEDPETIGANRGLIEAGMELGFGMTNAAYGIEGDLARIGMFGVSIGVGPTAEVQIDGGLVQRLSVDRRITSAPLFNTVPVAAGESASGLEDLFVATKIRVGEETTTRPAVGVRFGAKVPIADAEKGVGFGTGDAFFSFLIAKTIQSVRTVGNVGMVYLGNPVDVQEPALALSLGISVARAVTERFEVVGEINGRLPPFEEFTPAGLESRGVFRLAGRYTYSMLRLDFGLLTGITSRDPSFGISAGATYVISR